ncbi:MAG: TonB-dependent receptor [Bacteroidetes bacterium]|nr:TonB-dependent receptor [Bacteroidota bacterium]
MRIAKVILFMLLILSSNLMAGITGKLSGKVVDSQTGEALYGVNIIIEGTTYGAATDFEGEYFIINVPPGLYTIKISYIGYTTQRMEGVRIQTDLTTRMNISLSPSSISLNQEVMVVANKVIQKDLTSSERSFQSDQIDELPVRDLQSLLSLQAGVTKDSDGNIHIRGGRTSEISYMVDGVQVMNPLNRSAGISIDDQSIEELKAITGTFNAEYGQALSGVVNIVTKKGNDKFSASATAYFGDYFSTDDNVYYLMDNKEWATAAANALTNQGSIFNYDFSQNGINTFSELQNAISSGKKPWLTKESYLNSYNPIYRTDFQVNLSGPVPGTNNILSYFIAGRYQDSPGYQQGIRYYMPWGIWQPISDTENSFKMPDQEIIPLSWYIGKSTQSKLFLNFKNFSLSYGLYYNNDHSYGGGQKYLPDGGRHYYTDRLTQIFSATYVISNSTFLDFKGSLYSNKHKSYLYEDPYDYRYVPTNAGDFQQWMFRPTREDNISVRNNNSDFNYWGNDVGRSKSNAKYYSFNVDLTSQIDKSNLIKMGVSGRVHDLDNDYYQLQFSQVTYRPVVPKPSSAYHTFYSAKPKEFAAYIQDKLEFEELIINLGVRFDYFDSDGRQLADPADPQIYAPFKIDHIYKNYNENTPVEQLVEYTVAEREKFWYKDTKAKYQISPRFGISFPITAEGVIHFSYGHFFQNPEFQFLYTNPNYWIAGAGSENLVGNTDLDAERTVMYELGLQQQLFNNLYLHVTGFYRDIRDWISTGFPVDTYRGLTYYSYINRDHAVAKGVTLSAGYNIGRLSMNFDYTYMNAKGTSSNPRDAYNSLSSGQAPRVQLVDLNWDQPHSVNMIISYSNDGWAGTLIGAVNSGFPYTPQFVRTESTGSGASTGLRENSERRPTTINFDLRLSKTFELGAFNLQALLDITNLLDTRNANSVYADTGMPDFTLQDYQSFQRITEISSSTEYFTNPGMYTAPRSIQFGLRISYN